MSSASDPLSASADVIAPGHVQQLQPLDSTEGVDVLLKAAGGAVFLLVRWVRPKPVDPKYEALPCRQECAPALEPDL